jgi:predicted secreted hydrolase
MACDISLGRAEQCKDSIGGLSAVYFINYQSLEPIAYGSGNETDMIVEILSGSQVTAYKYELNGSSTFEQTITSSRENGTTFVDQKLTLNLKKLSIVDHKQLKLLAYGRPIIAVQDRNNNWFVAGLTKGMDLTSFTISTGAAMGDMSGYKLEFQGIELKPANFAENPDSLFNVITG